MRRLLLLHTLAYFIFGVFSGLHSVSGSYYMQICLVMASISLAGSFTTKHVFPQAMSFEHLEQTTSSTSPDGVLTTLGYAHTIIRTFCFLDHSDFVHSYLPFFTFKIYWALSKKSNKNFTALQHYRYLSSFFYVRKNTFIIRFPYIFKTNTTLHSTRLPFTRLIQ